MVVRMNSHGRKVVFDVLKISVCTSAFCGQQQINVWTATPFSSQTSQPSSSYAFLGSFSIAYHRPWTNTGAATFIHEMNTRTSRFDSVLVNWVGTLTCDQSRHASDTTEQNQAGQFDCMFVWYTMPALLWCWYKASVMLITSRSFCGNSLAFAPTIDHARLKS